MFTGIIKDLGLVEKLEKTTNGLVLSIKSKLDASHFVIGASVTVDGVCLTVESYLDGVFTVTAVQETLDKTNLSWCEEGGKVNLEPPLTLKDAVAGHLVLGHVDFVAEVLSPAPDLRIAIPSEFMRFMPKKGSVTLNGVSLTIADIETLAVKPSRSSESSDLSDSRELRGLNGAIDSNISIVRLAIIPETMRVTNLGELKEGWHLNVEVDMIARYLDQLRK